MTRTTIADVLRQESRSALAGRNTELGLLQQMATPAGPVVAYVHGPAGIGKTALLSVLAADFDDLGIHNVRIQAGAIEPRAATITTALGKAFGADVSTVSELANALSPGKGIAIVMVDDVDTWRLASTWLRAELLPLDRKHAPGSRRRHATPSRMVDPVRDPFPRHRLGALPRTQSDAAVAAANLPPELAERIWLLTGGHPLGMRMAIHAARSASLDTVRDAGELANAILHAIGDAELRCAVEACAVVRRANRALISAILKTEAPVPLSLLEAVEALPFATRDAEGIYIVEPVRQAIVDWMSGVDAERYQAWEDRPDWIVGSLFSAGAPAAGDTWRISCISWKSPHFATPSFPPMRPRPRWNRRGRPISNRSSRSSKSATASTRKRALKPGSSPAASLFGGARNRRPGARVYLFARQDDPHAGLNSLDPLFAEWQRHLAGHPVNGEVLFIRQISARNSEAYSAARVACVLDLKRNYIERLGLARIYCYASRPDDHVLYRLGFRPLEPRRTDVPPTMVLEVPGGDMIEWICALVDTGQGATSNGDDLAFARDRREIVVDRQVVELTPLEAQVLAELMDRAPAVVRREELIERIWRRTIVGSNVVDTVVRTLRRKLASERDWFRPCQAGYRYHRDS